MSQTSLHQGGAGSELGRSLRPEASGRLVCSVELGRRGKRSGRQLTYRCGGDPVAVEPSAPKAACAGNRVQPSDDVHDDLVEVLSRVARTLCRRQKHRVVESSKPSQQLASSSGTSEHELGLGPVESQRIGEIARIVDAEPSPGEHQVALDRERWTSGSIHRRCVSGSGRLW